MRSNGGVVEEDAVERLVDTIVDVVEILDIVVTRLDSSGKYLRGKGVCPTCKVSSRFSNDLDVAEILLQHRCQCGGDLFE